MDCSVLVATYNRAHLLAETLEALGKQDVPPKVAWEIVVVDNNSRDGTRSVVEEFASRAPCDVQYRFEARQGLAHARNTGVREARGSILAFTDDDVIPDVQWLARIVAAMTAIDLDGVGGKVLPLWETECPTWLKERPDLLHWLALMIHEDPAQLTYPIRPSCGIVGANMAFRRRVFEGLGSFDTTLGHKGRKLYGGEEIEFVHRLLKAGRSIAYDPTVQVHHRIGKDRLRKSLFLKRLFDSAEGTALQVRPPTGVPLILGAERWRYRQLMSRLSRTAWLTVRRDPGALRQQLELAEFAGDLWGRIKRGQE